MSPRERGLLSLSCQKPCKQWTTPSLCEHFLPAGDGDNNNTAHFTYLPEKIDPEQTENVPRRSGTLKTALHVRVHGREFVEE